MLTSAGCVCSDGNGGSTGSYGVLFCGIGASAVRRIRQQLGELFSLTRLGAQVFGGFRNCRIWIAGQVPLEVFRQGNCITGVRFADFTVKAKITLDATEWEIYSLWLRYLTAGAGVQSEWENIYLNTLTERYPVQAPTWVVIMQDFGEPGVPEIPAPPEDDSAEFTGAWDGWIGQFLNYGRLPGIFYDQLAPVR